MFISAPLPVSLLVITDHFKCVVAGFSRFHQTSEPFWTLNQFVIIKRLLLNLA